ncbi:hypothetical protein DICPUDRAFT_34489 [Dictyostelium purpureum]|uniref:Major facilitator superfamily associated domain-containing protein n=1 Tax=Dictyostelium purpureum TaxID=5786 RepID=F0ZMS4_DICPU|nr:uncharacterized protein DICPUDRAFT_34489 [Dictyostelium purpureum]EGC34751.1 hypothetical protein DICPUDRAFT_34489 [Dictyostelium purpureum]|eukprot:XP_003288713.1 hypothetical protein DICPUDRAFT_34489 [Dictyostelium purpureum]
MGEIIENFKKYTNIKLLYFFQFASLSCFQPFISVYLYHFKSIQPSIIGIITCLIPFISFIASPVWTWVTDYFQCPKKIIILNSILSTICLLLLIPIGDNLIGIFLLISSYSFISSPICPIVDSLVLKQLGSDSKLYGMQRLFGAISYGAVAISTGFIIQKYGLKYLFIIYGIWMAVFLVYYIFNQTEKGSKFKKSMSGQSLSSFKKLVNEKLIELEERQQTELDKENETKPNIQAIVEKEKQLFNSASSLGSMVSNNSFEHLDSSGCSSMSTTPPVTLKRNSNIISSNDIIVSNEKENEIIKNNCNNSKSQTDLLDQEINYEINTSLKQALLDLLKNTQMIIFLLACVICGMTANIISNFLFLFLQDQKHASVALCSTSLPFTILMELPFFFFGKDLLNKLGETKLIIVGHSAFIIRLCLYNIIAIDSVSPWFVLPIETLHGIAFASIWVAGVEYSNKMSPKGYETTYQGVFSGVYGGFGSGLGSIVGGFLYEHMSPMYLFRFTAILTTISLISFSLSQIYFSKKNNNNIINNNDDDNHINLDSLVSVN